MEWFVSGILFAGFNAATMLVNQQYKLDGHFLSGVRGVGVAILSLPFLFFVSMPTSIAFWILICIEAGLSSYFNARLYNSSARYGAGATSRISILAVVFGTFIWWGIDYHRFLKLCQYPLLFLGIIVPLSMILYGAILMNKESDSAKIDGVGAFRYMFGAVLALSVMMIVRKLIMQNAEFFSAAIYYCTSAIFLSGLINMSIFFNRRNDEKNAVNFQANRRRIAMASILIATMSFLTIFCGNLASYKSPNPSFVTAITLLSPLLIMIFNKFGRIEDKFDVKAILIMFVGIALLIYFSDIPLPPSTSSVFSKF